MHAPCGGVVPELASSQHLRTILLIVRCSIQLSYGRTIFFRFTRIFAAFISINFSVQDNYEEIQHFNKNSSTCSTFQQDKRGMMSNIETDHGQESVEISFRLAYLL
jgi:hypothetical protein